MRRTLFVLLALVLLIPAAVAADPGVPKVGFVFATKSAALRESPDPGAKEIGKVPAGARLVYRRTIEGRWYRVEPPGGSVGWIAAADVSDKRPGTLPPPQPVAVVDSGVGLAKTAGAQTAAARGLSTAAVEYAADREELKKAADEFVTLEHVVEKQFDDPHDANGDYPDIDVPKRKQSAEAFKRGIR